jgi:hypothetical protein
MFDPASRAMREGIGHYHCERVGDRRVMAVVTSVYPCAFDRGILTGVTRRFAAGAMVAHAAAALCRSPGDGCCMYYVTW